MTEQLHHLIKLSELPNVTIQVLPLAAGLHAGIEGLFTILTFPPDLIGDPGVVYTDTRFRGTYYENPTEIHAYRNTWTQLHHAALTRTSPAPDSPIASRNSHHEPPRSHQALRHADGWRKSTQSQGSDNCVEITTAIPGWVGVRDSKLADHSPTLAFTHDEWRAMLAAARTGEFDV